MGVGARLAELLREKNTNVHEVAQATGISASTLYSLIQRDSVSANVRDLSRLARHLGVGIDYFDAFGRENKTGVEAPPGLTQAESELIERFRTIDEDGLEVVLSVLALESKRSARDQSASLRALLLDFSPEAFAGFLPVAGGSLEDIAASCRCIRVSDESMAPLYPAGSIVLIRMGTQAVPGECGVFRIRDRAYFRQLGTGELRAINPAFPSAVFQTTSPPVCLGAVAGHVRLSDFNAPKDVRPPG